LSLCGGNGFVTEVGDWAGTGEVDIKCAPSAVRNLQTLRYSDPSTKKVKPSTGQEEAPM
jgi:hypothetical protein